MFPDQTGSRPILISNEGSIINNTSNFSDKAVELMCDKGSKGLFLTEAKGISASKRGHKNTDNTRLVLLLLVLFLMHYAFSLHCVIPKTSTCSVNRVHSNQCTELCRDWLLVNWLVYKVWQRPPVEEKTLQKKYVLTLWLHTY